VINRSNAVYLRTFPFPFLHPRKRRTRATVLTGGPGAAPGSVASKNRHGHMRVQRGVISYDPRCLCVCVCVATTMAVGDFKSKSSTRTFPPNFQTRPTNACHPLSALGRHAQYTRAAQVFIVVRVIIKRLNPGAAEDGAEDVLVVRRHLPAVEPTQRLPFGDT